MPKISMKQEDDKSIPLAIVRGGSKNGEMVYFNEKDREGILQVENLYDYVDASKVRSHKKYMTQKEMLQLKTSFEHGVVKDEVKDIYDRIRPEVEKQVSKHIKINDGTFEIVPRIKLNQVEKVFISGQSGSGKSWWIGKYMENYRRLFPDNEIYVFSRHTEDEALDKIKGGVKRIKLDDEVLDAEINLADFSNSLVVFDDIETIPSKKIRELVANIRDDLYENGRHHNIYSIAIAHNILNYKSTRTLILESDLVVFFPRSGQYQIRRFLKEYMGLDKQSISLVMHIPSRWICINKSTFPNTYLAENDIYIL